MRVTGEGRVRGIVRHLRRGRVGVWRNGLRDHRWPARGRRQRTRPCERPRSARSRTTTRNPGRISRWSQLCRHLRLRLMIAGDTIPMTAGRACENCLPARQMRQHYLRVRERNPLGQGEAAVGSYRLGDVRRPLGRRDRPDRAHRRARPQSLRTKGRGTLARLRGRRHQRRPRAGTRRRGHRHGGHGLRRGHQGRRCGPHG